jgi:glycosyltransferase involved in cell wall biosynthesis
MEALAAGIPVVARDLPVLREVFGTAALFADHVEELGAALLSAAGQPDATRRAEGRSLAARHTWDKAAAAHRRLYRSFG